MPRLDKLFKFREPGTNPEAVKPFLDHLEDLRWMIVKIAVTLFSGMVVAFAFHVPLAHLVERPLREVAPDVAAHLQVLDPTDPIIITFEVAFYSGIVITFPILLFFVAQFVLPALTPRERRILGPAIFVCFSLFLIGVLFSYFLVLPRTIGFFIGYAREHNWSSIYHVREYYAFVTQMTFAFGIAFELPAVVLLLVYLRVLSSAFLRRTRPFAVVIILILAAVIAPTPDLVAFASLGIPMYGLYEICIWLGWLLEQHRRRKEAALPG